MKFSAGELIFQITRGKGKSVEYYKDQKATNEKIRGDWLYTGDLVRSDDKGYLYFVGRNTESMRIKGENVSAYEVEQAIQKHPDVLEAAVYAVPSELAEDDIMILEADISIKNDEIARTKTRLASAGSDPVQKETVETELKDLEKERKKMLRSVEKERKDIVKYDSDIANSRMEIPGLVE